MLKNYFIIAIRSLGRNKLFTFLNIFGLALSMSVGLILILVMTDFLSSDNFNVKKDRIYRVVTHVIGNYGDYRFATSPKPVHDELLSKYPGIEASVNLTKESGMIMYRQNHIQAEGFYASKDFFNIFSYELETGNSETALNAPNSIILSKPLSLKLFQNDIRTKNRTIFLSCCFHQ